MREELFPELRPLWRVKVHDVRNGFSVTMYDADEAIREFDAMVEKYGRNKVSLERGSIVWTDHFPRRW